MRLTKQQYQALLVILRSKEGYCHLDINSSTSKQILSKVLMENMKRNKNTMLEIRICV